jgi:hypothetical protein
MMTASWAQQPAAGRPGFPPAVPAPAPPVTAGRLPAPVPGRYRFIPFWATQMG